MSQLSRRTFFAASGAAITVGFLPACSVIKQFPVIPSRPMPSDTDAQGWIRYEQGHYSLYIPRAEMGQNIGDALAAVACEALGIALSQLTLLPFNTKNIALVKATVGSDSIKDFAQPLKAACTTLKTKVAQQTLPKNSVPSEAKALSAVHRLLTGGALFAGDVRLPKMLYGRVLRAPVSPEFESKPMAYDLKKASADKGFVQLVVDDLLKQSGSMGLGIVARTPGALDRIEASLNVQWHINHASAISNQTQLEQLLDVNISLKKGSLRHVNKKTQFASYAAWAVDLNITVPMAAHGFIEPRCAVAAFEAASAASPSAHLALWVGSQDPFYQRDVMVKRLGLSKDTVTVHAQRVGGGFGGKTICTVELEAAVLSRACGLPIKVQWTRAQEFLQAFHRPPSNHRIRVGLNNGKINAWWHAFNSSHILFTSAALPPWIQAVTDFIGDDGVARGSQMLYDVSEQRIEFNALRLPVHTGPWRGLGAAPNALALESAVDEAAWVSQQDPYLFRLAHLNSPANSRVRGVLMAVAAQSSWATRFKPNTKNNEQTPLRSGLGIACGSYKGMSYAAVVAQVEISAKGEVRVTNLWCAHDCGQVIAPDGVKAQVEGNLIWCLGMVLSEALSYESYRIEQSNFVQSPMPLMGQVPRMHVHLIDSKLVSTGAGETAMVAGAAAIANAIKAATGKRVLNFPVSPAFLSL